MQTEAEYEILPRTDISEEERIWLGKAYYLKLLQYDSVDVVTAGREYPRAGYIFSALLLCIGLTEYEMTKHVV